MRSGRPGSPANPNVCRRASISPFPTLAIDAREWLKPALREVCESVKFCGIEMLDDASSAGWGPRKGGR